MPLQSDLTINASKLKREAVSQAEKQLNDTMVGIRRKVRDGTRYKNDEFPSNSEFAANSFVRLVQQITACCVRKAKHRCQNPSVLTKLRISRSLLGRKGGTSLAESLCLSRKAR